jgi:DegV family protein with EDD domain
VQEHKELPRTSLPSPAQIAVFYREIASRGDTIYSLHVASKMSGTFSAVQMAAQEVAEEIDVVPFDSGAGSAALGFMCREARQMSEQGCSPQQILTRLDNIRRKLTIVFTLDNLEFARLSGRISALQGALVSLLRIKPIIILKDGLLSMSERVRTRLRSLDRILEILRDRVDQRNVTVAVVHAADPDTAHVLYERILRMFNVKEIVMTELAIPVAANLGPGTVGIAAYFSDSDPLTGEA